MAASQISLVLLALLTLTASTSPIPTIFEILNLFGFPSGILPDSVASYSIIPAGDGDSFNFVVFLNKPCYVKYDYLFHFDYKITGKITYGKITELKGLEVQRFFICLAIDEIQVDGSYLKFSLGIFDFNSDIALFKSIPTCKDKAFAICGQSSNLIPQLPVIGE